MRVLGLTLLCLCLIACDEPARSEAQGAVRIQTAIDGATLFIDAQGHGALANGAVIELPPGLHVLEARRGGEVVGRAEAEVRAEQILTVSLVSMAPPPEPDLEPEPPPPSPPASGGLSPETVRTVVARNRAGMRSCYNTHLREGGDVSGSARLDARLTVAADGSVSEATVTGGDASHEALRACVQTQVLRWRFPSATEPTTISIPIVFSGSGDDAPAPGDDLPATPSRADVMAAMNGVRPAVEACGEGSEGLIATRISFRPDGTVQRVIPMGGTDSVHRCVENAVRAATVPPFRDDSFTVTYPFRL